MPAAASGYEIVRGAAGSSRLRRAGNSAVTIALVNGKTGGTPPSFVVCQGDSTTNSASLFSSCTTVSF
jgi:hypothetical protein